MTRRNAGEGYIRQRKPGLWEAQYTGADGRRHSVYGKTKRLCGDKLKAAIATADKGIRPASQELTTGDYLTDWLEHHVRPNVRPATFSSYRHIAQTYLIPDLGKVKLAKLEPEDIQRMLSGLAVKGKRWPLSPTTVRYTYSVLRIALGRALKLGRVHRNVATLIDPPTKVRHELRPMDGPEVREFHGRGRGPASFTAVLDGPWHRDAPGRASRPALAGRRPGRRASASSAHAPARYPRTGRAEDVTVTPFAFPSPAPSSRRSVSIGGGNCRSVWRRGSVGRIRATSSRRAMAARSTQGTSCGPSIRPLSQPGYLGSPSTICATRTRPCSWRAARNSPTCPRSSVTRTWALRRTCTRT